MRLLARKIRNALQILKMGDDNQATAREMREMMERQVEQMVRLVDDLFDVSRITQGTFELRQERVDSPVPDFAPLNPGYIPTF